MLDMANFCHRLFATCATLVLLGSQAHADCGFTHWGMSLEQVRQASNGAIRDTTIKEREKRSTDDLSLKALAAAPQRLGMVRGTQYFLFDQNNRLARADTYISLPKGESMGNTLTSMFGAPERHKTSWAGKTFQWQTLRGRIILLEIDNHASIICTPKNI